MESIIKKSLVILLIAGIFACDVDSNCGSINVDYVTFGTVTLNANLEEAPKNVSFDSIISPQTDSIFRYKDSISISSFRLPLSPVENQTDFFFYYSINNANDTVKYGDTIRFTYEKLNRVDSPECGVDFEFVGMDTAYQTFDSLVIVNDTLKRTINAPNIKLFIF
ncbi:DUF6452 family protein [Marivirga salinae]|uniref:DUF6452 family protein n=1 Tax=Marivirga salinarum TaxID=3059078 RepID=A0AA49J8V9_9BACT|nr:DUF6452 family protein [Marivirga sp. BDSF4-3]WKK77226.1 DUF6452 family protein [Marivirga sp. BDSF4-3]